MGGIGCGGDRSPGGGDISPKDRGPAKPHDLEEAVSETWDDLMEQIAKNVLRSADVHLLRTLSQLIVQGRRLAVAALADPSDAKLTRSWLAVADQIRKLSMLFGLSPADRQRLKIEPDEEPSELQLMIARRSGVA